MAESITVVRARTYFYGTEECGCANVMWTTGKKTMSLPLPKTSFQTGTYSSEQRGMHGCAMATYLVTVFSTMRCTTPCRALASSRDGRDCDGIYAVYTPGDRMNQDSMSPASKNAIYHQQSIIDMSKDIQNLAMGYAPNSTTFPSN